MIRFGPAGNEPSFYDEGYKSTFQAMGWLFNKGLEAYEYQCGRGVMLGGSAASQIQKEAVKYSIQLSLHAPYFINMATIEPDKVINSKMHMQKSYEAARMLGATRVCVHPGSFMGDTRDNAIKRAHLFLKDFLDEINDETVIFCPEVMGKINQLGDLDEVIFLCKNDERILPTVDFGHLNARTHGSLKTTEDFEKVIIHIENGIGIERTRIMHIHFSQIEYTAGGEKKHLTFEDMEFGPYFNEFVPVLIRHKMEPVIICESSDSMATDALKCRNMYYDQLKK